MLVASVQVRGLTLEELAEGGPRSKTLSYRGAHVTRGPDTSAGDGPRAQAASASASEDVIANGFVLTEAAEESLNSP